MNRSYITFLLLLCTINIVHAQSLPEQTAPGCKRSVLQAAADKYVEAMKKGDASVMPTASGVIYIENRKQVALGEGIWKTPVVVDFYRTLVDVDICETFTEVISANNKPQYVTGTRLKVIGGKITEIESLVSDKEDWLFEADNYLKYSSTENWDIIPPDKRSDRSTLVRVASDYFDIFTDYSSFTKVPWGIPCVRIEGGMYTNPKNEPNPSCTVGVPKGGGVQMTNRRYIVDLDMGAVVGQIDFGGANGLWDAHTFRLENGKLRYVHVITLCPNGCPRIPMPKDMPPKAKTQ